MEGSIGGYVRIAKDSLYATMGIKIIVRLAPTGIGKMGLEGVRND